MQIGDKNFDLENMAYIMGILNVTPDSFSDGGKYASLDQALYQVEYMLDEGASIIDVGGQSTRPGYTPISDAEEIDRVVPVIEAIRNRFDAVISLDTYKSEVARAGIDAGAQMINDIWGFKYDKAMATLVAKNKVACCLMHNREETSYNEFLQDVVSDLKESLDIAHNAGVARDKIIIDPGVGFAKNHEQNLCLINRCDYLKSELNMPLLLGTSRKSVIGRTLDAEKNDRVVGTAATTVIGYERGCRIFRVHDVKANMQALKMAMAITER